jgi:ribosomal silencing factor RsfS
VTFRLKAAGLSPAQVAAVHDRVVQEVTRDGSRWISETRLRGQSVLRMMVISYLTEERHLQSLQDALTNAANAMIVKAKTKA